MGHRYDEFHRLLSDQIVVQERTIREAERLGLRRTLLELKSIQRDTREINSNVLTKIEGAHASAMLEGEKEDTKLRRDFLAQTAALPPRDIVPQVDMFPQSVAHRWPCHGGIIGTTFNKEFYDATATNPEGPPGPETAGAVEACTSPDPTTEGE